MRLRLRAVVVGATLSIAAWSCGLGVTGSNDTTPTEDSGGASLPEGAAPGADSSAVDDANVGVDSARDPDAAGPPDDLDSGTLPPNDSSTQPDVPLGPATSCKDLRDRGTTMSGVYNITLPRGVVQVWCDMSFQGGGFTLVGRTGTATGSTPFGWRVSTGTPANKSLAYSLDARGLVFGEVLVAEKPGSTDLVTRGVVLKVPASFVDTYRTTRIDLRTIPENPIAVVTLNCNSTTDWTDQVQMIRRMGHTDYNDTFFVRDVDDEGGFGLTKSKWDLAGGAFPGCARSFNLHEQEGAIYVR